jgi:hypothetical protein
MGNAYGTTISLRNLASAAILPTAYVRQLRPPASKQDSLPMPPTEDLQCMHIQAQFIFYLIFAFAVTLMLP